MVWEKRCAKELQSVSLRWVDKFICVSLHCAQVDVVERLVQGLALIRVADAAAIGLVIAPVWREAHCALLGLLFGARSCAGAAKAGRKTRPARCNSIQTSAARRWIANQT